MDAHQIKKEKLSRKQFVDRRGTAALKVVGAICQPEFVIADWGRILMTTSAQNPKKTGVKGKNRKGTTILGLSLGLTREPSR